MEQARGSASARGYGAVWERFRLQFMEMLVEQRIEPICGAALPFGPNTTDSLCKAQGLINGMDLHLDHEPPLTAAERRIVSAVCDATRVQLLCGRGCHAAKTRRQKGQRAGRL